MDEGFRSNSGDSGSAPGGRHDVGAVLIGFCSFVGRGPDVATFFFMFKKYVLGLVTDSQSGISCAEKGMPPSRSPSSLPEGIYDCSQSCYIVYPQGIRGPVWWACRIPKFGHPVDDSTIDKVWRTPAGIIQNSPRELSRNSSLGRFIVSSFCIKKTCTSQCCIIRLTSMLKVRNTVVSSTFRLESRLEFGLLCEPNRGQDLILEKPFKPGQGPKSPPQSFAEDGTSALLAAARAPASCTGRHRRGI